MTDTTCPDESELAALLEGVATPAQRQRIDVHLAGCSSCAAVLAAYAREATDASGLATSAALSLAPRPVDELLADGATLGRFVILGRLGAGAMGVVYLAYDRQLDRKVAIKLVHAALLVHPDSRARLLREAQAMARISHANVITVYEAGEHEQQIYVVMELIRGITLRAWLTPTHTWRERLASFLQAGRGLAAAHAAGLVHRDFKPDNVLVGPNGEVKVTDFGLARALDGHDDARAATMTGGVLATLERSAPLEHSLTAAGAAVGTPAYMSPEQIDGRADARSDQFSFCVAVWEALHGQRPFAGQAIAEVWRNASRGMFTPVPRDSKVPARVNAALRRGLAARPEARFADMDALLAALAYDPAVRRRRMGVSLGLVAGLGLAGLAIVREPAPTPTCTGAAGRLQGVWDETQRARVRGALLATHLDRADATWERVAVSLDDYANAWIAAHTGTCLAHQRGEQSGAALDLRMSCLERRRDELAALSDALATIDAASLDEAARGAAQLRPLAPCADLASLQLRAGQLAPPPPERAEELAAARAEIDAAEARERTGQYAPGLVRADAALALATALDYAPLTAAARLARGRLLERLGRYEDADAELGAAIALADRSGDDELRAEAATWRVGVLGQRLARPEEAERWAEIAAAVVDRVHAPADLQSRLERSRGAVQVARGEYAAAAASYQRALAIREASPGGRAAALMGLSSVHVALGDNAAAERDLQEALPLLEQNLGPQHPELGGVLNNLANVQSYQGRRAEALATFERGLALREHSLGEAHPQTASLRLNYGSQLSQVGRHSEALAQLERARTDLLTKLGPAHPNIAYADANLGEARLAAGDRDAARRAFDSALSLREQLLGPDHPELGTLLVSLGELALASGDLAAAEAAFTRAVTLYTADPAHPHFDLASARTGLGRVALARGRTSEAVAQLEAAEAAAVASELDPLRIASIRFALARALVGDPATHARALALARLAEGVLAEGGPPRHVELAELRGFLAENDRAQR